MMMSKAQREEFAGHFRRRRGRPRSAEPVVMTSIRIPLHTYDAICRRAMAERESVHATLRTALEQFIKTRVA